MRDFAFLAHVLAGTVIGKFQCVQKIREGISSVWIVWTIPPLQILVGRAVRFGSRRAETAEIFGIVHDLERKSSAVSKAVCVLYRQIQTMSIGKRIFFFEMRIKKRPTGKEGDRRC